MPLEFIVSEIGIRGVSKREGAVTARIVLLSKVHIVGKDGKSVLILGALAHGIRLPKARREALEGRHVRAGPFQLCLESRHGLREAA